jgi:hypothetical protein
MYYYNLQVTVIGKIMNIEPEEETTTRSGKKNEIFSILLWQPIHIYLILHNTSSTSRVYSINSGSWSSSFTGPMSEK